MMLGSVLEAKGPLPSLMPIMDYVIGTKDDPAIAFACKGALAHCEGVTFVVGCHELSYDNGKAIKKTRNLKNINGEPAFA